MSGSQESLKITPQLTTKFATVELSNLSLIPKYGKNLISNAICFDQSAGKATLSLKRSLKLSYICRLYYQWRSGVRNTDRSKK